MNYHNKLFLKTLAITGVVLTSITVNRAFADEPLMGNTTIGSTTAKIEIQPPEEVELCPKGQYVQKCGDYRVGFNWLKSITFSNDGSTYTTKNYYIANNPIKVTSQDIPVLLEQMRTFFNADADSIFYIKMNNNTFTFEKTNTDKSTYKKDRDNILNYACNPKEKTISCAYCPNFAEVEPSTVKLSIKNTWVFHTIADCYAEEFQDTTGNYHYVLPEDTNSVQKCYYTNNSISALDKLNGDFISGIKPSETANATLSTTVSTN